MLLCRTAYLRSDFLEAAIRILEYLNRRCLRTARTTPCFSLRLDVFRGRLPNRGFNVPVIQPISMCRKGMGPKRQDTGCV